MSLGAAAIGLGLRAHSSSRTRRLVPAAAVFRLAEPYAARARAAGGPRYERLRRFHERLLEHTALAGQEAEVAERGLAEMVRCLELFWRPWLSRRGAIAGLEHYSAARASGRGIVAAFTHYGMPYAQFPILAEHGIDAWAMAGAVHFEEGLGDDYGGRFARQGRVFVETLGPGRAIVARKGAFKPTLERVRDGAMVTIAFDLTGAMPTPFLGREVQLASGPSRLAVEGDAVVLPFVIRREGIRPVLHFAAPVDPREHPGQASVQAAIAGVMERWALDAPEAVWPLVHNGTPLIHGAALEDYGRAA